NHRPCGQQARRTRKRRRVCFFKRNAARVSIKVGAFSSRIASVSPPSCPRIAIRRTASLRSPMSRASTSFLNAAKQVVDGYDDLKFKADKKALAPTLHVRQHRRGRPAIDLQAIGLLVGA